MSTTSYDDINKLLDLLLTELQKILGKKLVGLYLYGSIVWGDFDYEASDIDLMVAISKELEESEIAELRKMHEDMNNLNKQLNNRIDAFYISINALKTFKTQSNKIAKFFPGEPLHVKKAEKDWLMNLYFVQERGVVLFGPSPKTIINPISKKEFIQAVRSHAINWSDYIKHTRHFRANQAYVILTLSRALYAYKNGNQVSKKQAAEWAVKELPKWSALIQNALLWRENWRNEQTDDEETFNETVKFANFIIDTIER